MKPMYEGNHVAVPKCFKLREKSPPNVCDECFPGAADVMIITPFPTRLPSNWPHIDRELLNDCHSTTSLAIDW